MSAQEVIATARPLPGRPGSVQAALGELRPPESWPGAAGRKSVAPQVPSWPGSPRKDPGPGGSWPGAAPKSEAKTAPMAEPPDAVEVLRTRAPQHHVSAAARGMWVLGALLGWLGPFASVCAWMVLDSAHRPVQLVAFGLVVVLAAAHLILMPRTRYRIHRWEITPEVLYVQTGWLTRTRSIVALASLRAVETSHGPLTRVFGLTTVTVRSDSPVESVRIVGLGPSAAAHLRAELTRARA